MNTQIKDEFQRYSLLTETETEVDEKSGEILAFIDKVQMEMLSMRSHMLNLNVMRK